jgi:hypothetical protein
LLIKAGSGPLVVVQERLEDPRAAAKLHTEARDAARHTGRTLAAG